MFSKILIANRGEIAVRVARTARRLGVRTVAVYSEADRNALHVRSADEAYPIGPAPARESYLVGDKIIAAAKAAGAEAVHPGYGFLSENAAFAEACAAAGLAFIGPPPSAIRAMGSKSAAKALMEQSGVPLAPGYHGQAQDLKRLAAEAGRIGFPVLIKASAGGGGKGMRIAADADEFEAAVLTAKREAAAAFGDDEVLLEKYLTRPRHIEVQVFADMHGEVVSLFERDCSIQRRHQKVIEEAPAPRLAPDRREAICEAARTAARAVGYVGAGTVEFIAEGENFYFMEMNTRLQVEHPVTEAITGQDLVEWQLRVAAGEPLPLRQQDLTINGHAIEARVYAEDPSRDFAPATGRLLRLRAPQEGPHVRVDTGVREGDVVSVHYDPMIAKLVVWGEDREAARRRLSAALADYEIVGVRNNVAFLRAIVDHPAFAAAELDTGFIASHAEALLPASRETPALALAAAALQVLIDRRCAVEAAATGSADPYSPWNLADAWRLNGDGWQDLVLETGGEAIRLRAHACASGGFRLDLPGGSASLEGEELSDGRLAVFLDGVRQVVTVLSAGDVLHVVLDGAAYVLKRVDPLQATGEDAGDAGRLTAPMPGKIVKVFVEAGAAVRKGDPLIVLEAMKMEHTIIAPRDGVVVAVPQEGEIVEEGTELVSFQPEATDQGPSDETGKGGEDGAAELRQRSK